MGILYHYTSGDSLLNIIENSSVRATEINFLNDFTEYHMGISEVSKICNQHAKTQKYGTELSSFFEKIPEIIHKNVSKRQVFVFSLTRKRDNLRQWMVYGKQNSSYCIGFEESLLANLGKSFNEKNSSEFAYRLRTVSYGSSSVLKDILCPQEFIKKISHNEKIEDIASELINELMFECCSMKREEFRDEEETRLIIQTRKLEKHSQFVQYRDRSGVITPYVDAKFSADAIKEIIIGPMVHSEIAEKGLSQLVAARGFNDCDIHKSECTLRHF